MTTYALKRAGKVERTLPADNIDHALDQFFPNTKVDVDLSTASATRLEVRPLYGRRTLDAYVIEELRVEELP
jgi:hypothetical protein